MKKVLMSFLLIALAINLFSQGMETSPIVFCNMTTNQIGTLSLAPQAVAGKPNPFLQPVLLPGSSGPTPQAIIWGSPQITPGGLKASSTATLSPSANGTSCIITNETPGLLIIEAIAQYSNGIAITQEYDIIVNEPFDGYSMGGTFSAQ